MRVAAVQKRSLVIGDGFARYLRRTLSRRRSIVGTPLENWVDDAARLTKPERVVYCDGSSAEKERIIAEMLREGDSEALNEKTYPNCYLHRSSPNDVARTEHLTFICTPDRDDVGPTNNWMDS